jgi:hypothetical protein
MHVLMPATGTHVEKHNVRLLFGEENNAGGSGPGNVLLNGDKLDLSALLPDVERGAAMPDVVNLSPLVDAKVNIADAAALRPKITSHVVTRGGRMTHRSGLAKWRFPKAQGKPEERSLHMANWVRWTIPKVEVEKGVLELRATPLDGGNPKLVATLKPSGAKRMIHLCIKHLPVDETTTMNPDIDYEPEHFHAFLDVLGGLHRVPKLQERGWSKRPHVTAADAQDNAKRRCEWLSQPFSKFFGRTFACMTASAESAP